MAALTVVVPVWDRYVRWLDECVESILAQRAECDLRVLVLDNASTRPLPEQSPDVAMVRTPERLSVGAARNHALAHVETPLVAFADVDDLFPAGYFAFAVQRLLAREELVAVGMRPVALHDASGDEHEFPWPTDGAIAACRHRRRLALRADRPCSAGSPSVVMRGRVLRAGRPSVARDGRLSATAQPRGRGLASLALLLLLRRLTLELPYRSLQSHGYRLRQHGTRCAAPALAQPAAVARADVRRQAPPPRCGAGPAHVPHNWRRCRPPPTGGESASHVPSPIDGRPRDWPRAAKGAQGRARPAPT